jgi:molybdopterin converting factor small subunit
MRALVNIQLKLFASLADHLPPEAQSTSRLALTLAPGTTVSQVIAERRLPEKSCHLVLINGTYVPPAERGSRTLADGDELAIWPPVAGG